MQKMGIIHTHAVALIKITGSYKLQLTDFYRYQLILLSKALSACSCLIPSR